MRYAGNDRGVLRGPSIALYPADVAILTGDEPDEPDIQALLARLTPDAIAQMTEEELKLAISLLEEREVTWRPTDKQAEAERVADESFETLYGGAAGGGKSEWLLMRAWRRSLAIPGHRTLLLRRTYPELLDSLIAVSLDKYDHRQANYKVGEHTWSFKNGSIIRFGHMEQENDKYKYQSSEWHMIGFDELVHFTDSQYRYLISRCRASKTMRKKGARPHMIAGSNPGGFGGPWVKQRFIDPAPMGSIFTSNRGQTRCFIQAKLDDNPHIDEEYEERLNELDDLERRQLRDGDWDTYEGRFFTMWDRDLHVIEPFDIPRWWPRERGLDYGFANPWAVVWGAWSPDGELYVYRETYEIEKTPGQQVEILNAQRSPGEQISITYADPSIWQRTGTGEPVGIQYRRRGLVCVPAMNARVSGWASIMERLRVRTDADGRRWCQLYIFNTCTNLIRTLPSLPRADRNPEDVDTRAEDHLPDALRYLVMTHGRTATEPKAAKGADEIWERVERRHAMRGKETHHILGRNW